MPVVHIGVVDLENAAQRWRTDGFVVLPAYLNLEDLAPAVAELPAMTPTADAFHDAPDDEEHVRFRSEFGGIDDFPFASVEVSLLAVHDDLIALACALLGTEDIRAYAIESWAKYTGAAAYDQPHHRDYLNQTLTVPSWDPAFRQLELFVYLVDVPPDLGPPSYVPRRYTSAVSALPNWLPRRAGIELEGVWPTWVSPDAHPDLYDHEVSGAGPAGTVVAYSPATFHRGTELTRPRGARYTLHVNFRRADAVWAARHSWLERANDPEWHVFVARATPRQLALFGFPPPGHPFWTDDTLAGRQLRYPDLDLTPWRRQSDAS